MQVKHIMPFYHIPSNYTITLSNISDRDNATLLLSYSSYAYGIDHSSLSSARGTRLFSSIYGSRSAPALLLLFRVRGLGGMSHARRSVITRIAVR